MEAGAEFCARQLSERLKPKGCGVRWTALDDAAELPAFALANRASNRASNLEEFREAVRLFPGPAQNFVYADDAVHIAWYSAGRAPIRRTGDGSRPYPGPSDEGDWTALMPFEEFDRAAGRWPQYRLDNRGQHVTPSGGRGEDGALVLVSAGDAGALRRRRLRVLSDGRLAQAWEESTTVGSAGP